MVTIESTRYVDNDVVEREELSPEEQRAVNARLSALKKILSDTKIKGKYRLELLFSEERSIHKPVPGIVTFWESGTKLHGGGDARVYLCPGKRLRRNECAAPMSFDATAGGDMLCASCGILWQGKDVLVSIGEVLGRHFPQQWASLLLKYFQILEHNCDITLKHSPADLRSRALIEQEKQKGGELLEQSRRRAKHVYPLANIIKDTSAGADLYKRFRAFLTA